MKKFRTKVEKCGFPIGTPVLFDETKDTIGKTGQLLCTVPNGGALFFKEEELEEEVTR